MVLGISGLTCVYFYLFFHLCWSNIFRLLYNYSEFHPVNCKSYLFHSGKVLCVQQSSSLAGLMFQTQPWLCLFVLFSRNYYYLLPPFFSVSSGASFFGPFEFSCMYFSPLLIVPLTFLASSLG